MGYERCSFGLYQDCSVFLFISGKTFISTLGNHDLAYGQVGPGCCSIAAAREFGFWLFVNNRV